MVACGLLLTLAWSFGLFRPAGPRWADAAALLATALLLYLTTGRGLFLLALLLLDCYHPPASFSMHYRFAT